MKINRNQGPKPNNPPQYPRALHSGKLSASAAFQSVAPPKKAMDLKFQRKVTRAPNQKSAGKAVLAADKTIWQNRSYLTRVAPFLNGRS